MPRSIKRQFNKLFQPDILRLPEPVILDSSNSTSMCESPERRSIIVSHVGVPFTGYILAKSTAGLFILQRWLDTMWTPVRSKLCSDTKYLNESFIAPHDATAAAFVYFLVCGVPALGTGSRRRRSKAPAVKTIPDHSPECQSLS